MGLFQPFDREDQNMPYDASPKTSLSRLWELISRDLWDNFRAGFLAMLGCIPFCVGLSLSVLSRAMLFVPVQGLIGGALAGPGLCGLMDTLLRGLRDDPSLWWPTYRCSGRDPWDLYLHTGGGNAERGVPPPAHTL